MKLFKKVFKKPELPLLIVLLLLIIISGLGYYKKEEEKRTTGNQEIEEREDNTINNPVEKNDNSGSNDGNNQDTQVSNDNEKTKDTLSDVQIESVLLKDENNDISSKILGNKGIYTVQKFVSGKWLTVVSEKLYNGSGGLELNDNIPISETQRTYRVYRTIDNIKSGPKEILVDRNLVVTKDGVNSFPGAL